MTPDMNNNMIHQQQTCQQTGLVGDAQLLHLCSPPFDGTPGPVVSISARSTRTSCVGAAQPNSIGRASPRPGLWYNITQSYRHFAPSRRIRCLGLSFAFSQFPKKLVARSYVPSIPLNWRPRLCPVLPISLSQTPTMEMQSHLQS